MRFIVRFISIVAFVRIDFVAATKAIPNSIFIAMVTGDTTPAWFEAEFKPVFDALTVAREVVATFASEPTMRAALNLDIANLAISDSDTEASLFLAGELAAAQEARACLATLDGKAPVNSRSMYESDSVDTKSQRNTKNINSVEAQRNFLAYRSTVVTVVPPLSIVFPHEEGLRIAGDHVMVRLTLGLQHCAHKIPLRGTDYERCRQLFLHDTEICAWFEQHEGNTSSKAGNQSSDSSRNPTCGPLSDSLAGGVQLHGLSPGKYTLHLSMRFSKEHWQKKGENSTSNSDASCSNSSPSLWRLADLTRTFVVLVNTGSTSTVMVNSIGAPWELHDQAPLHSTNSHMDNTRAENDFLGSEQLPPRPMFLPSAECGSYVDDSEWCVYRPACLDTATLGLVLLNFAPDSLDTSFQLGRKDDFSFFPSSLDRSSWTSSKASNNDLPHRSAALARHLSASSFADAEKRGAVAWFDPGSDDDSSLNGRAGRVGLMFVDTPENIYHAATKALHLSYAAKEAPAEKSNYRQSSYLDAVVPIACTEEGCLPAHASHDSTQATSWLDGLMALLFSNATTQVIHDPRAWASAIHEKTTTPAADGKISPVELLCFREVVVPGENRALFRGPADARRFRFNARQYLGLSSVIMHPPPKVLVVQRSTSRRIVNLNQVLAELNQLTSPAQTMSTCTELGFNSSSSCASHQKWWEGNHPAYPGGGRGPVSVEVLHLEDLGSFEAQATAFATAGVVVLAHGAGMANLIFAPAGAAVIELKQYGDYSTIYRDLCAAAQLHHTVLRNAHLPPSSCPLRPLTADETKSDERGDLWWCPSIRPGSSHQGTPMSFCDSMTYRRGHYDILVEPLSSFRHAAAEAVAVTGLRPLACEGQWRPGQHCPSAIGWGA